MSTAVPAVYRHDRFLARKQLLKVFGGAFRLTTEDGELLAYCRRAAFKLKEDIRVYADEAQTEELLHIRADRVVDFSAAYSVVDSRTGLKVGSLRRKGWSSMLRDSWEVLDASGAVRGKVVEDEQWKALVRRFVEVASLVLPQAYHVDYDGRQVGTITQNFLGIPPRFTVDLSNDPEEVFPRPLAIATVILLLAVEGRQG